MSRVVIVGGGLAGHRAAHTLRKDGFDGELVLVGDEVHKPYDRPPLSKALLSGTLPEERVFLPGPEIEVDWTLGAPATGIDLAAGRVYAGDEPVPYDHLIIATGRRARPWPELPELTGFHTLRSLDDGRRPQAAITPGIRAVIVGGGFIGVEVAATLRGLGVEQVTVVDVAPYPMPVTGAEVGKRAIALHEAHGVQFRLASGVTGFEGDGAVEAVTLADGERLEADLVLLALGAIPNTEWLADSGLTIERGNVVVDDHCFAVGVENVAVAGDMAAFPHPLSAAPVCIEHWATAREMGALAARNLLAEPADRERFLAVPTFWSDQYDVKIKSAGLLGLADSHTVVDENPETHELLVEAHRGDQLVGVIAFNRTRAVVDYQRQLAADLVTN